MTTLFNTDQNLGVNLNRVDTTIANTLGQRVTATNGSTWIYCLAPATTPAQGIAQYDFVTIDNNFNAVSLISFNVKFGYQIGLAQQTIAAGSYGWICITGQGLSGYVAANITQSGIAIPSSVTGKIDTTAGLGGTGSTGILGIAILTTAGATAGIVNIGLTSPVVII